MSIAADFFSDSEIIASYSRAEAIEDGVLVDVSETAREARIKYPVAMTIAAYEKFVEWTEADNERKHALQDEAGRLWDVLVMFALAARRSKGDRFSYTFFAVPREGSGVKAQLATLKAVCGPGDTPGPVITLMLPEES